MSLTPKYLRDDKTGKLIKPEKFIARETAGWLAAIGQAIKETAQSGKQFIKECEQGASEFGRELTGTKKKRRK